MPSPLATCSILSTMASAGWHLSLGQTTAQQVMSVPEYIPPLLCLPPPPCPWMALDQSALRFW